MGVLALAVEGGSLWVETAGEGDPPFVLLHGASTDSRMWDANLPRLSAARRTIRYDRRGFGRSAAAGTPGSSVDDLEAVLDALEVEEAVLVGSSDGARIAAEMAVARPERIAGVVLVGPSILTEEPRSSEEGAAREELTAALAPRNDAAQAGDVDEAIRIDLDVWAPRLDTASRERLEQIARENPRFFHGELLDVALEPPVGERMEEIRAPTLVVIGGHDTRVVRLIAHDLAERIPHARLVELADGDHFANVTAQAAFEDAVLAFV